MRDSLFKYGTFMVIPFVIIVIVITLCTLKVREKTPVTLVCFSEKAGRLYVPQNANFQISIGKRLVLETAQYNNLECRATHIVEEKNNKLVLVQLKSSKNMSNNSIYNAYIITNEVLMFDLVLQKVLKRRNF